MSWLSKLTHTEGLTPNIIKRIGDVGAPLVLKAIPGGGAVDSLFDLTNSRDAGASVSMDDLIARTTGNLQSQGNAALAAANREADQQSFFGSAGLFLKTPMGMALVVAAVVVAILLLRKK